jgi:hypothetical protein
MVFSRETGNYPPLPPDHRDVRSICQLPAPEFLARLFATVNPLPNLQPTKNLAPTDDAPVIRLDRETGARNLDVLKGGLISPGSGRVRTNAQKALSCSHIYGRFTEGLDAPDLKDAKALLDDRSSVGDRCRITGILNR